MLPLIFVLLTVASAEECNRICHLNYDPVCGSDGQTYANMCELESLSCLAKKPVSVVYKGTCADKTSNCNIICHPTSAPVCGTDGQTYGNTCELESLSCLSKSGTKLAYHGKCTECQRMCTREWNPVCGTDGVTYGNSCELTSQACLAKKSVKVAHQGSC